MGFERGLLELAEHLTPSTTKKKQGTQTRKSQRERQRQREREYAKYPSQEKQTTYKRQQVRRVLSRMRPLPLTIEQESQRPSNSACPRTSKPVDQRSNEQPTNRASEEAIGGDYVRVLAVAPTISALTAPHS